MAAKSYPTWESQMQLGKPVRSSVEYCRLRWYLQGSISESIHVLQDATDPNSPQDAYQTEGGIHPIYTASLTDPPIASILVSVSVLDDYESEWRDIHERHQDLDNTTGLVRDGEGILRCICGQHRPFPGPTILIEAEPGEFLTIGKYVNVVHPWLSKMEGHIRLASDVWNGMILAAEYDIWLGTSSVKTLAPRNNKECNSAFENLIWTGRAIYARKMLQSRQEAIAEKVEAGDNLSSTQNQQSVPEPVA